MFFYEEHKSMKIYLNIYFYDYYQGDNYKFLIQETDILIIFHTIIEIIKDNVDGILRETVMIKFVNVQEYLR